MTGKQSRGRLWRFAIPKNSSATFLAAFLLAVLFVPLQAQEPPLRTGYILCQDPIKLTFFIEPTLMEVLEGEAPDSVQLHPQGHARRKQRAQAALKAYECRPTDGIERMMVQVLGGCTILPNLPNGGCHKVRLPHVDPSDWHTFGDAIVDLTSAAVDSLRVITPGNRARLCLVPNCGPRQHAGRIPTGTKLPILDSRQVQSGMQTNRWYFVRYRGGQGWVSEYDVQRVE